MTIKELINELKSIDNDKKTIVFAGNQVNYEDPDYDIKFDRLDLWNDGDETITLYLSNGETN